MKTAAASIAAILLLAGCGEAPKPLSAPRRAPQDDALFEAMRQIVVTRYRKDAGDDLVEQIMASSFIQATDLNGDGKPERLVDVQYRMDSTGNRGFFVLGQKGEALAVIGEMGGDTFRVLNVPAGRYAEIETVWNNTDGSHVRRVYRFDGQRYLEVPRATVK